ncbi:MAG: hypothetical protein ACRENS_04030 [Candidatus Eiseniibacteriota bacterium]
MALHGDVVMMGQVKHQESARPPEVWAQGAIENALKQLRYTNRMLSDGHVKSLRSPTLGELTLDAARYTSKFGLIVLDQPAALFDATSLVPAIEDLGFPVHVFSLKDFAMIAERLDTAADLVIYLEMRHSFRNAIKVLVHDEARTLGLVSDHIEDWFRAVKPSSGADPDKLALTVNVMQRTLAGEFLQSPHREHGQAFDDIIARMHDIDPTLPGNRTTDPRDVLPIVEELGWLSRARRVALGRGMLRMVRDTVAGGQYVTCHFQRPRGIVFVYLCTGAPRSERGEMLRALVMRAQAKYDCRAALGVATEPLGAGRSYDAFMHGGPLPGGLVTVLRGTDDPFGDDSKQLVS